MKYTDVQVGFREIPDKISLLINISGCKCHCPGCHSPHLWEDVGNELTIKALFELIEKNNGVNTVCFMGGFEFETLNRMAFAIYLKWHHKLNIAWYTGLNEIPDNIDLSLFDYVKVGPYIEEFGPLDKKTTNQRLYKVLHEDPEGKKYDRPYEYYKLEDITYKFWDKEELKNPIQ